MTILEPLREEKTEDTDWDEVKTILQAGKIQSVVINYGGRSNFQIRLTDVRLQPGGNYVRFGEKNGTLTLNFGRKYKLEKRNGIPSTVFVEDGNDVNFVIHLK